MTEIPRFLVYVHGVDLPYRVIGGTAIHAAATVVLMTGPHFLMPYIPAVITVGPEDETIATVVPSATAIRHRMREIEEERRRLAAEARILAAHARESWNLERQASRARGRKGQDTSDRNREARTEAIEGANRDRLEDHHGAFAKPIVREPPELPVAPVDMPEDLRPATHILKTECDHIANALQSWAPWARRDRIEKRRRRYEGFPGGYR